MNHIDTAYDFINEGFNPLPLNQDKSPKLPAGHKFLYDKIDLIEKRFKSCDKIGIACGMVSDGFYAIDFDAHSGQNINEAYNEFITHQYVSYLISNGQVSVYKTSGGGYHLYFRCLTELKHKTYARWEDSEVMIEIRATGQYVCTWPSVGYTHHAGCELLKLDYIEYDEVTKLFDLANTFDKSTEIQQHEQKSISNPSGRSWPDRWPDTPEGKYNNESSEEVKQLLTEAGWSFVSTRSDGVELWRRPGKSEGISATFGQKFNMFYCFSGSALPFKERVAYSPFNILTILKFNNDWKEARKSLRKNIIVEEDPEPAKPGEFPLEIFPKYLREYILELKRTLNFHPDFTSVAAMFTIATVNGNKYKLKVKNGWIDSTIFWFACVGYPGAIKTHPVKTMIRPLQELDYHSKNSYDLDMVEFNRIMAESKGKSGEKKPRFKQCLISDYTVEALHSIHDINRRGIGLYKDELRGFLNDMNKYRKGSDEEFWLESFNNGSYIVNRVTKEPIMINKICINIIGTIQHDVLNKLITAQSGNGLIDRFLFTAAEDKVYNLTDAEIDPEYADVWKKLIIELNEYFTYNETDSPTDILEMSPEAFNLYREIDAEFCKYQNDDNYDQDMKNYLSKMKTYVPRFALLMGIIDAAFDGTMIEVGIDQMKKAQRLAEYFTKTAETVFASNSTLREMREIDSTMKGLKQAEKVLKLHFEKGYKQSDIAKFLGKSKQYVNKIIKQGQEQGMK